MKKAFTLIELLVVVLIIGILSAVAVPQYQVAVAKSRLATLKNLARSIKDAQELYYLENGEYTAKFEDLSIEPGGGELDESGSIVTAPWGTCELGASKDALSCWTTKANLSYQLYYDHTGVYTGRMNCTVLDNTDEIAHKVCKTETGKISPAWSNTEASSYRYNSEN